jgi:hypothetical protein
MYCVNHFYAFPVLDRAKKNGKLYLNDNVQTINSPNANRSPFLTCYVAFVSFVIMTSPYLQRRLRSLDEAVEDRILKDLRRRHKINEIANRRATIVQTGNVYRFGPRVVTIFGNKT